MRNDSIISHAAFFDAIRRWEKLNGRDVSIVVFPNTVWHADSQYILSYLYLDFSVVKGTLGLMEAFYPEDVLVLAVGFDALVEFNAAAGVGLPVTFLAKMLAVLATFNGLGPLAPELLLTHILPAGREFYDAIYKTKPFIYVKFMRESPVAKIHLQFSLADIYGEFCKVVENELPMAQNNEAVTGLSSYGFLAHTHCVESVGSLRFNKISLTKHNNEVN